MKIGIDAGHGGKDPGAVSPIRPQLNDQLYTEEEDITLDIAKRVQGILLACGHEVVMTRQDDSFISLSDRTKILNQSGCDMAVSIHLNSTANPIANYISTFIQQLGGKAEQLAKQIQPRLAKVTGWPNGGIRVANLHMTRVTKMPAVLLELGFVSNPIEEIQLNRPDFRAKLSAGIADGILAYTGQIQPWQKSLLEYATDRNAGQAAIKAAGEIYSQKKTADDSNGAEATHRWANQIRQAMGVPTT